MKYFLLLSICSLLAVTQQLDAQCSNEGREFYVAFPANYPDSIPRLTLYLSTRQRNTTVKVEYGTSTVQTVPLTVGVVASVVVPANPCQLTQNRTVNSLAGIHVYSVDGTSFSLYGMSRVFFSTDAFTGIPVPELGTRYRLASYTKDSDPGDGNPECAVIATEDNTVVTFDIPGTTSNPTVVTLNKRQCYLLQDPKDLTGGTVTSTKPIALFSGNQCTYVPTTSQACDMLLEQLLPTPTWGKHFAISPYAGRPITGDIIRLIGDSAGTLVYFNGGVPSLLGAGAFVERNITMPTEITSTKPIQVIQYAKSFSSAFNGDPFMIADPPVKLFRDGFTFSVPTGADAFTLNYVSIIALAKYTSDVTLDGAPISTPWIAIPSSGSNKKFSVTNVRLSALGSHEVSYSPVPPDSDRYTLSGNVYGWGSYDSYGYVASFGTSSAGATIAYEVHPDSIVLDTVIINHAVDSSVLVINRSNIAVRIGSIHFQPDSFPATVKTILPQRIAPNDTLIITFRVLPKKPITYYGKICAVVDSPCVHELCVPVTITGNNISICIETSPTSTLTPGDAAFLPVVLTPSDPIAESTETVNVEFFYDKELLRPTGTATSSLGSLSPLTIDNARGKCTFLFTANGPLSASRATIAEVEVQALLAPKREGNISVSPANVKLTTNEFFTTNGCSSNFIIGESCIKPEQLRSRNTSTISGIYPNPARANITIIVTSSANDNAEIEVTDVFGRVITKTKETLSKGEKNIALPVSEYPSGVYFAKLKNASGIEIRPFNVYR